MNKPHIYTHDLRRFFDSKGMRIDVVGVDDNYKGDRGISEEADQVTQGVFFLLEEEDGVYDDRLWRFTASVGWDHLPPNVLVVS